ncbi:MAG TPA: hypothetical protein VG457_09875 [Planctomycetota bacterium]|nr:hypothetical protein [Planctomycetota bacterium]
MINVMEGAPFPEARGCLTSREHEFDRSQIETNGEVAPKTPELWDCDVKNSFSRGCRFAVAEARIPALRGDAGRRNLLMSGGPRAPATGFLEDLMSSPNEKDKNRQGSTGRPATKFIERPRSESDAGKDQDPSGKQDLLDQLEKESESPSGSETPKKGSWDFAHPKEQDPKKKSDPEKKQPDRDPSKSGQKPQSGHEGMGKEE